MKASISVAIATFNEEKNIINCLDSVGDWVNEIIVVDGESTDNTVELIKKFSKAKVIVTSNKSMFHINKNKAIEACTSNWILFLDADEIISKDLKNEILETIEKDPVENGYYIPRINYFLTKFLTKGGQYPDGRIRLFKNGKGKWPCVTVHEQIEVSGKIGYLKNDLIHISDSSFERYLMRSNRYTSLEAENILKKEKDNFITLLKYLFIKPVLTFILIYIRHRGYKDGFPGFVFALYSGIHWVTSYIKFWEGKHENRYKYTTS